MDYEFKVGDRFITTYDPRRYAGAILEIVYINKSINDYSYPYTTKVIKEGIGTIPFGFEECGWRNDNDMQLVLEINENNMSKISNMMKKLLDKDTQILVKAGYINGDLDLTPEGLKALNTIVFLENKTELVKLANEKLAEEKDTK